MVASPFKVTEHIVNGCHVREYADSTANSQEEILQLHVKQYTPIDKSDTSNTAAVTIIGAHGVGFPKELYEPLWSALYQELRGHGWHIGGIWIADCVNMGQSGVLNENKLSTDFSWMDHARDLLLIINQFRDQMPRPLVGIGHSFGGCIMSALGLNLRHFADLHRANLAYLHPRLLSSVLLLDPVIQLSPPDLGFGHDPPGAVNYVAHRTDVWPDLQAAAKAQAPYMKGWDQRCVDLMMKYGFRELPTALYPEFRVNESGDAPYRATSPVTLTTTKHQDILGQIRENFSSRRSDGTVAIDRSTHADIDPLAAFIPLYRPEPRSTWYRLPTLRPSAFFLLGERSFLSLDEIRQGIKTCGQGTGGNGGMSEGSVSEELLPKHGHLYPFEVPEEAARRCATWLDVELKNFADRQDVWARKQAAKTARDHLVLPDQWFDVVKSPSAIQKLKNKAEGANKAKGSHKAKI